MNDNLNLINSRLHNTEMQSRAAAWRRAQTQPGGLGLDGSEAALELLGAVVIRSAGEADAVALRRLAQLVGRGLSPRLQMLVAEIDGEVVAALPIAGGEAIADPFRPTAALVEMLRLRGAELRGLPRSRPRRGVRSLIAQLRPA